MKGDNISLEPNKQDLLFTEILLKIMCKTRMFDLEMKILRTQN